LAEDRFEEGLDLIGDLVPAIEQAGLRLLQARAEFIQGALYRELGRVDLAQVHQTRARTLAMSEDGSGGAMCAAVLPRISNISSAD
jgi:hypothetical protein